jgi:hypothetical protein
MKVYSLMIGRTVIAWMIGLVICTIITAFVLKIGWQNPQQILIWGYGILSSASIFAWGIFSQIKARDMKEITDKLEQKADIRDLAKLDCKIELLHESLDHLTESQEEIRATMDNVYKLLLDGRYFPTQKENRNPKNIGGK